MLSTAEGYRTAALEHLGRARDLHADGHYYLAHYFCGLAVECLLRAYLRRKTNVFNSRHDIEGLAVEAGFFDLVPSRAVQEFGVRFSMLNLRWRSNHRYSSEKEWLDHMTAIRAEFNLKGDRRQNHSRVTMNLALDIINIGDLKW